MSVQYVIDLAAKLSGADSTVAQLDAMAAKLVGVTKDSTIFADAQSALATQLKAAGAASASADAALAAGNAEYRQLERAATMASKAVERAVASGKSSGVGFDRMQAASVAASAALEKQVGSLRGLEGAAAAAAAKEKTLALQLESVRALGGHVNKSFTRSSEGLAKLQGGLGAVGGPLGRLGQLTVAPVKGFADLSSTLGSTNATALVAGAGLAAVAVAAVALAAALAVGVASVAKWAIGLADVRRQAGIAAEAFNALNPALAGLDFGGVAADTGVADVELRKIAKDLRAAGVAAGDMGGAMRAVALRQALGQGGTSEFIADMRKAKQSVGEFATATQAQLGDIVARQMLGLEAQGARLRRNLSDVFGGLNVEPALNGLARLIGLFDASGASGNAIRTVFQQLFQPLIDKANNASAVIEGFALGVEIGLMKLYLAAKPTIKAVAEFFGFKDLSLTDMCKLAASVGEKMAKVFAILAVTIGGIAAVIVGVTGAIFAFGAALVAGVGYVVAFGVELVRSIIDVGVQIVNYFRGLPSNIVGSLAALGGNLLTVFVGAFTGVLGMIASVAWSAIGGDCIAGLVAGITGSAGNVIKAVTGAVGGAINAAKKMLGIASPSKVFASIGVNTGEGFTAGVDDSASAAQRATERLVAPPDVPALAVQQAAMTPLEAPAKNAAAAAVTSPLAALKAETPRAVRAAPAPSANPAVASGEAPGPSINLAGAKFEFNGVKDAEDAESRFSELLTKLIEGDASQLAGASL